MRTLPVSLAAAALALGLASTAQAGMSLRLPSAPSLVQKAGCYDDCEYYLEALQEAREEAHEVAAEAAEYAAEQAEEYGYSRRASRRQARAQQRFDKPAEKEKSSKSVEEKPAKTSAKTKDVAANASGTCKQYSPATGMLLSVTCE